MVDTPMHPDDIQQQHGRFKVEFGKRLSESASTTIHQEREIEPSGSDVYSEASDTDPLPNGNVNNGNANNGNNNQNDKSVPQIRIGRFGIAPAKNDPPSADDMESSNSKLTPEHRPMGGNNIMTPEKAIENANAKHNQNHNHKNHKPQQQQQQPNVKSQNAKAKPIENSQNQNKPNKPNNPNHNQNQNVNSKANVNGNANVNVNGNGNSKQMNQMNQNQNQNQNQSNQNNAKSSLNDLPSNPSEWTTAHTAVWLVSLGKVYEEYRQVFIDNGIDGDFLKELDEQLLEEIVVSKLHRRKIMSSAKKLFEQKS